MLTGILKSKDYFLVIKRNKNDEMYPGAWEFPGGHLEENELLLDGLKRELKEEIAFDAVISPQISHYYDEIINKDNKKIHMIEIDFVIEVNQEDINVVLSDEHCDYAWVKKDSPYLDDFILAKLNKLN